MTDAAREPKGGARRPTGRRPGSADTRGVILDAARAVFGELGFERGTIRAVAARARVDPALVHHYFGTKEGLFVAAVQLPVEPADIAALIAGSTDQMGERLVSFWLDLLETPSVRPLFLGLVRSATTDPVAAAMLRRLLTEGPLVAAASALPMPDARLRVTVAASQLIGLVLVRYVVGVDPLASASRDEIVRIFAPTIQRYLVGSLGPAAGGPAGG